MDTSPSTPVDARSAAVLGHPVEHSLSPVLHLAAYAALGLDGWTYDRVDCPAGRLAGVLDAAGPDRVGFSVTMPGKFEALERAEVVSDRARTIGSANTLVRRDGGWFADCTDVDGARGALDRFRDLPAAPSVVVAGVGGTARPVLAGLAAAGVRQVTLLSRRDTAGPAVALADRLGLAVSALLLDDPRLPGVAAAADLLVSTVPADGAESVLPVARRVPRIFDVLYSPRPTPLATCARSTGADVVGGEVMLLHQAFGQVELFTGLPAPRRAMAEALEQRLGQDPHADSSRPRRR